MDDYEPLDISQWCNAGVALLGEGGERAIGELTFRGLPFLVGGREGGGGDNCFVSLGESDHSVTIPINHRARRVIVAHRLPGAQYGGGRSPGTQVAEYVFRLSGGKEVRVPIRERFEIGVVPTPWGVSPFRAVSDLKSRLMPRYEGRWESAGYRQTEAAPPLFRWYSLWAWENPEPEESIESLEVIPAGPRFILAALTLGRRDEHPFAREGRRLARITLTQPQDATKPFNLDLDVDRGDATYVHPLPDVSAQAFMDDAYRGWGQEQSAASSPAYVKISAVPSATLTVRQDGEKIGAVNWGTVEEQGSAQTERARVEFIDLGKNWVHVKVLDEETGRPVPCRVHFRSPEGVPFQPHGHHNHVNSNLGTWHIDIGGDVRLGQITYAYIDGTCRGWLPRGDVIVDVARGFEYEPVRTKVTIEPGQRELTLRIGRWTDMNAQGWFSGDSHVHFLSTQGAHFESQGEDLNVVNLLQSQWGSLFTNTEDFTGAPSVSRSGRNIVYASQENRQHFMGHMILWGLKEPVMPWCSDGLSEAEIGGTMEVTLSEWADQCHAQGGYVISPHFPNPNGEPAALVATSRLDAVEMIRQEEDSHEEYYHYLNCGYRLPLVGGTDKMSSDVPVGLYRTYVRIPEDEGFSYENWCTNVARGRTFLSAGPIVHFSVEGHEIGDTVQISGPGTVEVAAWAESIFPINRLEIVQGGRVVAMAESRGGARLLEVKEKLYVQGHTWFAARCGGPEYYGSAHFDVWRRGIFAHTSPIYVACGGEWWMFDEGTAQYMLTLIEGDLAYIRETSGQHRPGTVTHHHGEEDHIAYLERPFLEARHTLRERMRRSSTAR